jgi:hypothetical protein
MQLELVEVDQLGVGKNLTGERTEAEALQAHERVARPWG